MKKRPYADNEEFPRVNKERGMIEFWRFYPKYIYIYIYIYLREFIPLITLLPKSQVVGKERVDLHIIRNFPRSRNWLAPFEFALHEKSPIAAASFMNVKSCDFEK